MPFERDYPNSALELLQQEFALIEADPGYSDHDRERIRNALAGIGEEEAGFLLSAIHKGRALDTLERTLNNGSKKYSIQALRSWMEQIGNEVLILDELTSTLVKKYFEHLSGKGIHMPYFFPLPLQEEELNAYLDFELNRNDPDYQDCCVLEFISFPLSSVGLNLLISHLKTRPAFLGKILKDPRLYDKSPSSFVYTFSKAVQRDPRFRNIHPLLYHLLFDKNRLKFFGHYYDSEQKGAHLQAKTFLKKLQKADDRFLKQF